MITKNWYVCNSNGDLAGHDMSEESAKSLASNMKEKEPDMEWEAIDSTLFEHVG